MPIITPPREKKRKAKKYKCPNCSHEFNVPKKHSVSKMKICPGVNCGYIASITGKLQNLSLF